jgi:putative endonuclease
MNLPGVGVMSYYVYVLSAGSRKAIQVGLTDDLMKGVYEDREKAGRNSGVKSKKLLHYEIFDDLLKARFRQEQIEKSFLLNKD